MACRVARNSQGHAAPRLYQLMLETCSAIKLANRRQLVIAEPAETRELTEADLYR